LGDGCKEASVAKGLDGTFILQLDPGRYWSTVYLWIDSYLRGCDIRGNISIDSGEKIYHVPGGEFYDSTTIDPAYGEQWFCTEAEARANGWRRSSR
jgi:hypothetical protein